MYNLPIELEASNPERNVHRFYRIWVERDLFNTLLVCTQYGRIGSSGRVKQIEVFNLKRAEEIILKVIAKRVRSEPRIGVSYRWVGT